MGGDRINLAILETEVWITLNSKIIKHYEDLHYRIPKTKNKSGRLYIPRGTRILVKVDHLIIIIPY